MSRAFAAAAALLLACPALSYAQDAPPPWHERIQFGGDFRSRYEGFYQQDEETRHRARLRLRLRVDAAINDDLDLQVQLASGDPGTPVSTNQSFDDFFTTKPLHLDRAFIAYTPGAAPALTLGAGKFPHVASYTQMLLDDDLNFEGAWESLEWEPGGNVEVALGGLQTVVSERSSGPDAYMLAVFGGATFGSDARRVKLQAANYSWGQADRIALAQVAGDLTSSLTNALAFDSAGSIAGFASRFNVVDLIAEATLATPKQGYPLRLLGQWARNTRAAGDRDSGIWVEAEYGSPRAARTWGATYTYGWVEQDVTPSAFVFSDMPGTNVRLHMLETSYVLKAGASVDTTLHFTKPLEPSPGDPDRWLTRLHLAIVVRF